MSQATIELLRQQRSNQVEYNPSSELFQIVNGGTFRGTFDEAHLEDNKDKGNILQKKLTPLIMIGTFPTELVERESKIIREDGVTTYTFNRVGKDEEGIPILWLF